MFCILGKKALDNADWQLLVSYTSAVQPTLQSWANLREHAWNNFFRDGVISWSKIVGVSSNISSKI